MDDSQKPVPTLNADGTVTNPPVNLPKDPPAVPSQAVASDLPPGNPPPTVTQPEPDLPAELSNLMASLNTANSTGSDNTFLNNPKPSSSDNLPTAEFAPQTLDSPPSLTEKPIVIPPIPETPGMASPEIAPDIPNISGNQDPATSAVNPPVFPNPSPSAIPTSSPPAPPSGSILFAPPQDLSASPVVNPSSPPPSLSDSPVTSPAPQPSVPENTMNPAPSHVILDDQNLAGVVPPLSASTQTAIQPPDPSPSLPAINALSSNPPASVAPVPDPGSLYPQINPNPPSSPDSPSSQPADPKSDQLNVQSDPPANSPPLPSPLNPPDAPVTSTPSPDPTLPPIPNFPITPPAASESAGIAPDLSPTSSGLSSTGNPNPSLPPLPSNNQPMSQPTTIPPNADPPPLASTGSISPPSGTGLSPDPINNTSTNSLAASPINPPAAPSLNVSAAAPPHPNENSPLDPPPAPPLDSPPDQPPTPPSISPLTSPPVPPPQSPPLNPPGDTVRNNSSNGTGFSAPLVTPTVETLPPLPATDPPAKLSGQELEPHNLAMPPESSAAQLSDPPPPPVAPVNSPDYPPRVYAGFWRRYFAAGFDGFIFSFIISGIFAALYFAGALKSFLPALSNLNNKAATNPKELSKIINESNLALSSLTPYFSLISYLLQALYASFFIAVLGATPGKLILGLRVKTSMGKKVGFGRALLRELVGKWISLLISPLFGISYLWMLWDKKKQTIHDKIANTIVVRS